MDLCHQSDSSVRRLLIHANKSLYWRAKILPTQGIVVLVRTVKPANQIKERQVICPDSRAQRAKLEKTRTSSRCGSRVREPDA